MQRVVQETIDSNITQANNLREGSKEREKMLRLVSDQYKRLADLERMANLTRIIIEAEELERSLQRVDLGGC